MPTWQESLEVSSSTLQPIIDVFTTSLMKAALPLAADGLIHFVDASHGHHWCLESDTASTNSQCKCGLLPRTEGMQFKESIEQYISVDDTVIFQRPLSEGICSIVDNFSICKNALSCAVSLASMLVTTANIIKDTG